MNPIRRIDCDAKDCPNDPFDCRFYHGTGEEWPDMYNGFPKYFCPHEWEIAAVK